MIVGTSKGGLASAAAIVVPMLSLVMNPVQAAATLLPVFIATDWVAVWLYRREFSAPHLAVFVPGLLCGTVVATLIVPWMPEAALLLFTGAIGLWHCLRSRVGETAPAGRRQLRYGFPWGMVSGIASFITHSGMPPAQAWLLPQRLPKLEFAGTIAIAFAIGNLAKIPGYHVLGQYADLDGFDAATLIAAGIVGTVIGRWAVQRVSDATYRRVIETLLLALSIFLVGKGIGLVVA